MLVDINRADEPLTACTLLNGGREGTALHVARSSEEALDFLSRQARFLDGPQIVLFGLELSEARGIDMLHLLKTDARARFTKMVVFTSSKGETQFLKEYGLLPDRYIEVPTKLKALDRVIRRLILLWPAFSEQQTIDVETRSNWFSGCSA